ncbi:MAG: hypothetical protein CVU22_23900 [Betaproteobacteria bacterium HGW-Betaproteobacteria-16]|nr:MAG: hypothetical protein CVU22_23900 [Betaproteobacteria bacterium HGW-Betaproteobacteria-16]
MVFSNIEISDGEGSGAGACVLEQGGFNQLPRHALRDEDKPRTAVFIGPGGQAIRRVDQVLRGVHHQGLRWVLCNVDQALEPQQLFAAQRGEQRQPVLETCGFKRLIHGEAVRLDVAHVRRRKPCEHRPWR